MFTHSTLIKPLVEYKIPNETIQLERQGEWEEVAPKEFNKQFNITRSHGIYYNQVHHKLVNKIKDQLSTKPTTTELNYFLQHPKNYFAVRYINPTCGYGLFALEDIPKNTVVGIYSSELIIKPINEVETLSLTQRAYDMSIARYKIDNNEYDICLRALHYSDDTRFAVHLPSPEVVHKLSLSSNIPASSIATANMNYPLGFVNGKPVRYYKTTCEIKKGEIAGIDYGSGYWARRGAPSLFVREGSKLKIANYDLMHKRYSLNEEKIDLTLAKKRKELINEEAKPSPPKRQKISSAGTSPRLFRICDRRGNKIQPAPKLQQS